MFTESFFTSLLSLESGWVVKSVSTDASQEEVRLYISCELKEFKIGGKAFKRYDYAPSREWRHLDTLQYKTFLVSSLPRYKDSEGKVKTLQPPWADAHERHSHLFEKMVIDVL